jgi:fucose 4-O-acetylase-like acetyltransferase
MHTFIGSFSYGDGVELLGREGSYIWFFGSRALSTFIILISPWYMPLLFVLAGVSARLALKKRTYSGFVKERLSKLLLPLISVWLQL